MRFLLLFLARREAFKNFALRFGFFRKTARRFVPGETLDDAILAAREANRLGIRGTMALLGENTRARAHGEQVVAEVLTMLDRIRSEQVDCHVSVKPTHLGLDLDADFACQNLCRILQHARKGRTFIRVDMEGSAYTERTLDLVLRAHQENDNVGAVIQSYLYRSESDVRKLLEYGVPIRLCKGAYLEPDSVAFRKKSATDANFIRLMKLLLESDIYHALATHDEAMISATKKFCAERQIGKEHFEFQMLYGVRRDLQQSLVRDGYNVRIYIPFGHQWFPYFMRRLAERPANVIFIIRNLLRG
jgi:proline dehydrogenase